MTSEEIEIRAVLLTLDGLYPVWALIELRQGIGKYDCVYKLVHHSDEEYPLCKGELKIFYKDSRSAAHQVFSVVCEQHAFQYADWEVCE